MNSFVKQIHSITNLEVLKELKESIKNQVIDPTLRWDERMILYTQVQLINEWISELLNTTSFQLNMENNVSVGMKKEA